MSRIHVPSGWFSTEDAAGRKVERETRTCAHCGFTWVYEPGSGRRRGVCLKCMGVICCTPQCPPGCTRGKVINVKRDM